VPFGQFLYPNQTWWVYVDSVQGGDGYFGAQFQDSFGNKIGNPAFPVAGSSMWLYTGTSSFAGNYFLEASNISVVCGCGMTIVLSSQICNGYVP
jgi:hypothetical protein